MQDIDFLPDEYRQRRARRRMLLWRHAVTVTVCLVVATWALYQRHARHAAMAQLAAVNPQYDLARRQTDQLNKLQAEFSEAQANAQLITYLRHPWPRSRLLAELLRPLPVEITFTALQIGQQQPTAGLRAGPVVMPEKQKEPATEPFSSVKDLKKLREEEDHARTVVTLEGTTADSDALHRYLGQLNDAALFSNAELESFQVEQVGQEGKVLRFVATLEVEPAYGLPGGPTGPPPSAVAALEAARLPADPRPTTTPAKSQEARP